MKKRLIVTFLLVILVINLTGCGNDSATAPTTSPTIIANKERPAEIAVLVPSVSANQEPLRTAGSDTSSKQYDPLAGLSDVQRNSIVLLNHLVAFTQEINSKQDKPQYLEQAYSSLLNNINPSLIDQETLNQYNEIFNQLRNYIKIDSKRNRLKYVLEQNRALAVQKTISSCLKDLSSAFSGENLGGYSQFYKTLLDSTESPFLSGVVVSVALFAEVASIIGSAFYDYDTSLSESDLQYIQDRWKLDDDALETLFDSQKNMLNHSVKIIQTYSLPNSLTLTDKTAEEFNKIETDSNIHRRIQRLEDTQQDYLAHGKYWLVLAKSYFENEEYEKCINSIKTYEALDIRYLRKDYDYANILMCAIASTIKIYQGDQLVDILSDYVEKIERNSDNSDWFLRYYSAQTYAYLYSLSNEIDYLQKAYNIAKNNISNLSVEQSNLNFNYLNNKQDSGMPEAKLPPVFEPLVLNCALLFELAEKLDIPETERNKVNSILHENNNPLYLAESLDGVYYFPAHQPASTNDEKVEFWQSELKIPAKWVTNDAFICVTVQEPDQEEPYEFTDWSLTQLDRGTENDLNTFVAVYNSNRAKEHSYSGNADIFISIVTYPGITDQTPYTVKYRVVSTKNAWYDQLKVWDGGIWFERVMEEETK